MILKIVCVMIIVCDDIMKAGDIDSGYILLGKKPYENILIYDILYKTFMGAKPLRISRGRCRGLPVLPMQYSEMAGINFQN